VTLSDYGEDENVDDVYNIFRTLANEDLIISTHASTTGVVYYVDIREL